MRVGIIGGGAAGMMAAICIKRLNKHIDVSIHEKNQKLGKKLLTTGNGRCNYTNADIDIKYYNSEDKTLAKVFDEFDFERCIDFFKSIGVEPVNKNSYIYPMSEQAAAVVKALELKIKELSVNVILDSAVDSISCSKSIRLHTEGKSYDYDRVLISCGGFGGLDTAYKDSIYPLLKKDGYNIIKPLPALCPLVPVEIKRLKKTEGVRARVRIGLYIDGQFIMSESGELQFTKNYLSGIVIFQLSRHVSRALEERKKVELSVDFLPYIDNKLDFLQDRYKILKNCKAGDFATGLINNKLWEELISELGIDADKVIKESDIKKIADKLSNCRYPIKETGGFTRAQVSTGGVALSDINLWTMESILQKNVYFAGEVADVDGICGGYNLHWAWASGYLAAKAIAKSGL